MRNHSASRPPRPTVRALAAAAGLLGCLALGGCDDERQPLFSTTPAKNAESERQTLFSEIAQLANGKHEANDAGASKAYDEAKDTLIARGAAIENELCESLASNTDWGVRLGCVEVLESVGTKICIPTIIAALDDPEPVVALYASHMLSILCKHEEIPATGAAPGPNGLPPLPAKAGKRAALDADLKGWVAWHQVNHAALRKAWDGWWVQNKDKFKLE